ncbi:MAG: ferrous iron transport protein A [Bacilli bacterium]|nr:ferrous iron transport protein A [Bacilli bacterium]
MPIMLAPLNEEVRVIKILANDKIKKHLESLGILVNSKLTVISSVNGGVIVIIKNGRLALDHEIASKILVA